MSEVRSPSDAIQVKTQEHRLVSREFIKMLEVSDVELSRSEDLSVDLRDFATPMRAKLARIAGRNRITLKQIVAAYPLERVEYSWPATWWDHVKLELLPPWLRKWLKPPKIEYRGHEVESIYPTISFPEHQDHLIMVKTYLRQEAR